MYFHISSPAIPALKSGQAGLLNLNSRLLNFAGSGALHLNSAVRSPGPHLGPMPKDIYIYFSVCVCVRARAF